MTSIWEESNSTCITTIWPPTATAVTATYKAASPTAGITGWEPTTDYTGATRYRLGDKGKNGAWQDNLTAKAELELPSNTKLKLSFMKSTGEYSYDNPATYLRNSSGAESGATAQYGRHPFWGGMAAVISTCTDLALKQNWQRSSTS